MQAEFDGFSPGEYSGHCHGADAAKDERDDGKGVGLGFRMLMMMMMMMMLLLFSMRTTLLRQLLMMTIMVMIIVVIVMATRCN